MISLVALSGCGSRDSKTEPAPALRRLNLLLVTIDTLRADRLGCYGYSRVATPNLDRLASSGVLFEGAVTQAPLTAPSHASMMTGVNPPVHKVRDTGGFVLPSSQTTLATILQGQGWDTAAFIGAAVLKRRFGLNQGFSVYDDEFSTGEDGRERRAGEVVDRAIHWLGAQSAKPFFLWVHVYDPHLPYDPPAPFREKYKANLYDGEVAYTDRELGRLFQAIAQKSPSNTLVAVLSDHGESFGEHGEFAHGVFLYDTTLRVAFLLSGPGVPAALRVKQQARTIDLLPTLLELMGGKAPAGVQGASLVPAFAGKEPPQSFSYGETLFPKLNMGWAELRSIRTNRWKYVRAPKPELYDLVQDPGETNNVLPSHPADVRDLEAKLDGVIGNAAGQSEKVQPAPVDRRTLGQLKSLGYLSGSSQQTYELTGKGIDPKDRLGVLKLLHLAVDSPQGAPLPRRIAMLRQGIAEDPANPALYSNLGDLYKDAGRQDEAMQLYRDALHNGVRSAWLYSRLGYLYLQQGNKPDAIVYFERAAQANPSDYESLGDLATLYRETGKLAEAGQLCNFILQSGEEYAPAYNELGMISFQNGNLEEARGYFEKAAQLDSTYQLNLGRLYKTMGDKPRARASFEAFLAARSSRPEYRQLIPMVKQELAAVQ